MWGFKWHLNCTLELAAPGNVFFQIKAYHAPYFVGCIIRTLKSMGFERELENVVGRERV